MMDSICLDGSLSKGSDIIELENRFVTIRLAIDKKGFSRVIIEIFAVMIEIVHSAGGSFSSLTFSSWPFAISRFCMLKNNTY